MLSNVNPNYVNVEYAVNNPPAASIIPMTIQENNIK